MPIKEGIFTPADDEAIRINIKNLFNKTLAWDCQTDLTRQELFEMAVPEEHRQLSRDAVTILGMGTSYRYRAAVDPVEAAITVEWSGGWWYYPQKNQRWNSEHPARDKFVQWGLKRRELGRQWGLVLETYRALNHICTRQQYVRNFWPPIVTLLGNRPAAAKLANYKASSSMPDLPAPLRRACTETMELITMACLIPEGKSPEQEISLEMSSQPTHSCPWGGSYTGM
jgi:hypothetical protein